LALYPRAKGRPAKRIDDEVRERFDPLMQQTSKDRGKEDIEDITAELTGIFDLTRKT
jgi:hypothetical protein